MVDLWPWLDCSASSKGAIPGGCVGVTASDLFTEADETLADRFISVHEIGLRSGSGCLLFARWVGSKVSGRRPRAKTPIAGEKGRCQHRQKRSICRNQRCRETHNPLHRSLIRQPLSCLSTSKRLIDGSAPPATRAASYPTRRAGSRDCGCMVRGLARRRCGSIVSQHTAIRHERLLDHTGNAQSPAPTACRHRGLGGSAVLFRAMRLHAVGARAR